MNHTCMVKSSLVNQTTQWRRGPIHLLNILTKWKFMVWCVTSGVYTKSCHRYLTHWGIANIRKVWKGSQSFTVMGTYILCGQFHAPCHRIITISWITPMSKAFKDHTDWNLDGKAVIKSCFHLSEKITHKIKLSRILYTYCLCFSIYDRIGRLGCLPRCWQMPVGGGYLNKHVTAPDHPSTGWSGLWD